MQLIGSSQTAESSDRSFPTRHASFVKKNFFLCINLIHDVATATWVWAATPLGGDR
jgi:hypothetical protein